MTNRKKLLIRQPIMRRMIIATIPCILAAIYFFGWRSLALIIVACAVAYLTEYFFVQRFNEPVSEAVFVSAILYTLILPPTVAWHVMIIGMVFAIIFGKMVFGGFGRNIFNPAMTGRAFVYICFPIAMTATWAEPAQGLLGGLGVWTTALGPDAITSATPMALVKAGQATAPGLVDLLIGRMSGTMGVTSGLAILFGGTYVFFTRTANRRIIISIITSYILLNALFILLHVKNMPGILPALLGGGFLFGAFFMATDPVSAPKMPYAQIIYAILIALCTILIRTFSVFNGGLMFSILFANMFAPILDFWIKHKRKKKATETS